jgi:hypothetical protein
MLYERPVSLVSTGISLAIMIPECSALLERPSQVPGSILIAGAVIGAAGIYLGSTLATSYYKTPGRNFRLMAWGFFGMAMSISLFYFGLRVPGWGNRLPFFGAGCLPLGAYLYVLLQAWREGVLQSDRRE